MFREWLDFQVLNSQFIKRFFVTIHRKLWWIDLFTNMNHLTSCVSFWLYQYFRRRKKFFRRNEDKTTRQGYLATTGLCNLSPTESLYICRGRNKYSFFSRIIKRLSFAILHIHNQTQNSHFHNYGFNIFHQFFSQYKVNTFFWAVLQHSQISPCKESSNVHFQAKNTLRKVAPWNIL